MKTVYPSVWEIAVIGFCCYILTYPYNDRKWWCCCCLNVSLLLCRPFKELSENVEGSLCRPQKSKGKRRPSCSGGLDTENTPNELIQQWSPPHKKTLTSAKGKENEENVFVLARRPRKRRESSGL